MQHFGIIGKPLGHSQSKTYFDARFAAKGVQADYTVYELMRIEDVTPLLDSLDGISVTSPYKETVMTYLDKIDETAKEIGAVNLIYKHCGYNTDWIGAMAALKPYLRPTDKQALILGSGGAAHAVKYALEKMGLNVRTVSRQQGKGDLTYGELTQEVMKDCTVIANCTPLGMKPLEDKRPDVPYQWITNEHVLFDCIYNPEKTLFLAEGEKHGATIVNGAEMFVAQAKEAEKIYNI